MKNKWRRYRPDDVTLPLLKRLVPCLHAPSIYTHSMDCTVMSFTALQQTADSTTPFALALAGQREILPPILHEPGMSLCQNFGSDDAEGCVCEHIDVYVLCLRM
jgi:hypothetical protein